MTGVAEGGVQIATGFMESLKREPLSLALVAMNLCLLLFFYVILVRVADQRKEEIGLLYADKKEVRELLARCVVPPRDQRTDSGDTYGPPAPATLSDHTVKPAPEDDGQTHKPID